MQDIENNMDELFRKAAENYAPKKGESQWDNILPALSESSAEISTTKKNNSQKYTAFLLLVLFVITSGIILMKISGNKNETTQLRINTTSEKSKPAELKIVTNDINKKSTSFFHDENKEKKLAHATYNKTGKIIKESINKSFQNSQPNNSLNIAATIVDNPGKKIKNDERNGEDMQIDSVKKIVSQFNNIDSTQNTVGKKNLSKIKQRKLYIGFVAAPEFNQIKNQGIKKPGFDIGLIAGYKLNSKASLETGLLLNKKNYFSDGKYFSMDKIGASMPAGMEVMSLEGSSSFLKIPVKLKYDVLHKKNATVFSSAGVSSYIIINEKNNYLTLLNGSEQQMTGSYKNATRYFAATVDISAGCENKIGKFTSMRIEPYLQLPLKGMGVGSMPVMSAGLHVSIIKFIR